MILDTQQLTETWQRLAPVMVIRDEAQCQQTQETLNTLLDEIGDDETHPLYDLLDTLGTLIQAYETDHHPIPEASSREVLRLLMDEHLLDQSDLPELGCQDAVSEILTGERSLNVHQIHFLARRFSVSPAVFV